MGEYYYIVNQTKKVFISLDLGLALGIKFQDVGWGLNGIAISRLLCLSERTIECPGHQSIHLGAWVGDVVAIVGDQNIKGMDFFYNFYYNKKDGWKDITVPVLHWLMESQYVRDIVMANAKMSARAFRKLRWSRIFKIKAWDAADWPSQTFQTLFKLVHECKNGWLERELKKEFGQRWEKKFLLSS